jgi:hypothetical protein
MAHIWPSSGGVSAWAWCTYIQTRPGSLLASALARSGGIRTAQLGTSDGKLTRTVGSEASEDRKRRGREFDSSRVESILSLSVEKAREGIL